MIYECDFLPITNGNQKHYVGGIITILYMLSLAIMISGVTLKYLYFNERIENSQISGFETLKYPQSSIIIKMNIYATVYSNKTVDFCDIYMLNSSNIINHKFKLTCKQIEDDDTLTQKRKKKISTNQYQVALVCEECELSD